MDINRMLPPENRVKKVLDRDIADLPAFPAVALKVVDLIGKDDTGAGDIARVIESDPAVTVKVLRLVNSAAFGLHTPVSTVKDGIMFLGISRLRQLALQVTLFEQIVRPRKSVIFDRTFFWQHCLAVAGLSMAIAEEIGYPNPEEAYVAGLLHDVGKTILDGYGRISYGDFLKHLPEPDSLKIASEQKVMGISHDDIGAFYCASCDLPDRLLFTIKFHHQRFAHLGLPDQANQLLSIVSLSNFLAWTQGLGSADMLRHPVLLPEVETCIDFAAIRFPKVLERMDREIKRTADLYQFQLPSSDQFRYNLLRANIQLARANTVYHFRNQPAPPLAGVPPIVNAPPPVKTDEKSPAGKLPGPDHLIRDTIRTVREEFGFDRLYILKIDSEKRCLVPVHVSDVNGESDRISPLQIAITGSATIVTDCMRKRKPVIIDGSHAPDRAMLELFGVDEIGFLPFSHNNRLQGLLGLDNYHSRKAVDPADLHRLGSVARELGVAMDQISPKNRIRDHVDPLTKLHTRQHLTDQLQRQFQKGTDPLFLVMIEIDAFREFVEEFGYLEGESLLKLVAGILHKLSRFTDCAARFETDRFMVMLTQVSSEQAMGFCERIRQKIEKLGLLLLKRFPGHAVTVSIGTARCAPAIETEEVLVDQARKALARARENGGNRTFISG